MVHQMNKRARLLNDGTCDSDHVLDSDDLARMRAMAQATFQQAVDKQEQMGCRYPDGTGHVKAMLTDEFPAYCWVIIRYQENNLSIDQPVDRVHAMYYRDFLAFGFLQCVNCC